jgi:hypothetical protein
MGVRFPPPKLLLTEVRRGSSSGRTTVSDAVRGFDSLTPSYFKVLRLEQPVVPDHW